MEVAKPIKRNAAIVEFSKDHHFALLLVWKIRTGLKKLVDPLRISRYVIHFYDTDLIHHFNDEEEILFTKLLVNNKQRVQAEREHRNINELIDELRLNLSDITLLMKFADYLEKHIRFEERELFHNLQQTISNAVLNEIALTVKTRYHEPDSIWPDIFWDIKNI